MSLPAIASVAPPANTHTAPVGSDVSAVYDQDINPGTVSDDTFVVHGMQRGRLLDPPNTVAASGATVTCDPSLPFHPGELVQVTATTGIQNPLGEGPASPFVWQFRTAASGGSGYFAESIQELGSSYGYDVALGDLDEDGDLDAFVANGNNQANTVWLNDGAGTFADSGQTLGSSYSRGVVLGDLDGDGDLDAFVANGDSTNPNRVWLNDGAGTFNDSGQTLGTASSLGVDLGDVDGDGDLDAVVANTSTAANAVWLNDGAGTFVASSHTLGTASANGLALGDLDGDGDLDAVLATTAVQASEVWLNDGTGTFTDTGQTLGTERTEAVALGDLDGDGDLDAFLANSTYFGSTVYGADTVWLNDGTGTFSDSGQSLGSSKSKDVDLGDLDGDGDLDAMVTDAEIGGANQVWLNDGTGTFASSGQDLGRSKSEGAGLGDLDGDGDLDAFVANLGQADHVWKNVETAVLGTVWHDVDGDGYAHSGEPRLEGQTIYLDANDNGQLDAGETSATTDAKGNYVLDMPAPATYVVRQVVQSGWEHSVPVDGFYSLTFTGDEVFFDKDFGNYEPATVSGLVYRADPEFQVNSFQDGEILATVTGIDGSGNFVVVWTNETMPFPGTYVTHVYLQRYDASRRPLGEEVCIGTTDLGSQSDIDLAMHASGNFVVVWTGPWTGGPERTEVYGQRFDASGTPQGTVFRVNTTTANNQENPRIAMDPDGNFVVVWESEEQDGSAAGLYGQRYNAAGVPQGGEFQVHTFTTGDQIQCDIAMDADGDFVVVWASRDAAGTDWGLYAQRFDSAGTPQGGEFAVNPVTSGIVHSSVAMDAGGSFFVVWANMDTDNWNLHARRYDAAGNLQGDEFLINATDDEDQRNPQVVMDAAGNYVVLWSMRVRLVGDHKYVRAQRFDASGAPVGYEFSVNTRHAFSPWGHDIALNANGDFVASWRGSGGAQAQTFSWPWPGLDGRTVYADLDRDGIVDPEEPSTLSAADGSYSLTGIPPGYRHIREASPAGWETSLPPSGYQYVTLSGGQIEAGRELGSYRTPSISGVRWEDVDNDGLRDPEDHGLSAWTIYLDADNNGQLDAGETSVLTYGDGKYAFGDLPPGTYVVGEVTKPGWVLTVPQAGSHTVTVAADEHAADRDFAGYLPAAISGAVYEIAPDRLVNTVTTGDQANGDVAVDADGDAVVVWQSAGQDGSGLGIFAQRFDAAGTPQGSELQVNTTTNGDQERPRVVMDSLGNFAVVWESQGQDGDGEGIFAQRFDAAGNPQGTEFQVNTTTAGNQEVPVAGTNASGHFVILWRQGESLLFQRFDSTGAAQGTEVEVTSTADTESIPDVAMDSSGNFVVAWTSVWDSLRAQRYDASGVAQGSTIYPGDFHYDFDEERFPSLAMQDDGRFVVVWQADALYGIPEDIFARRYDAEGNPLELGFRVNLALADRQTRPSVAMDATGNFVVAWQSHGGDGQLGGIFARRFDSDGSPQGAEFQVNLVAAGDQSQPAVAMDDDGDFVAAWQSDHGESTVLDVYAKHYPHAGQGQAGVTVFLDADNNAQLDAGELSDVSGADGTYAITGIAPGTWAVRQVTPAGWLPAAPLGGFHSVSVGSRDEVGGFGLSNQALPGDSISGQVYDDWNADGINSSEPGLAGRTVYLDANNNGRLDTGETVSLTNSAGYYVFGGLTAGEHVVRQVIPEDTWPTAPLGAVHRVTLAAGERVIGKDFGNYRIGREFQIMFDPYPWGTDVAMDATGRFVVVWGGDHPETWADVNAQRYDPYGVPDGDRFRINTFTDLDQVEPSVAMGSDGSFVVTWCGDGPPDVDFDYDIFVRQYDANGTPRGDQVTVDGTFGQWAESPSVAMDAAGNFIVAWHWTGNAVGIAAQRFDAAGAPQGGKLDVVTLAADDWAFNATVGMDAAGNFVVVWDAWHPGTEMYDVFARRYNAAGEPQGAPFRINTTTFDYQLHSVVDMDADGDFVVTWSSWDQDGSGYGVYAQRFNAAGEPQGGEIQVNTTTDDWQMYPDVAVDPDGDFVVAWESYGQDGSGYGVYARRYNAAGEPQGDEFPVNTTTHENQRFVYVATNADGDVAFIWQSGADWDDYRVFGAVFPTNPLGSISGRAFSDLDDDGVFDAGEPGLAGWTIYVDADADGILDPDELTITTDADGGYTFSYLPAATYTVRQVVPSGWRQTLPADPSSGHAVNLTAGQAVQDVDFGNHDIAPPELALAAPAWTLDTTPGVTLSAADNDSLPDGTPVMLDVDLSDDGDFDDTGELGYTTSSLSGGQAAFDLSPELACGTYLVRARTSDPTGNEGDDTVTLTVGAYLDFGTPDSTVQFRYFQATAWTTYDPAVGYGWQSGTVLHADRYYLETDLTRDFNCTTEATFALDVPDGMYDVTVMLGDVLAFPRDEMAVYLEGQHVETVTAPPTEIVARTYRTAVSDGQLTLGLEDLGGSTIYVVIAGLEVEPAPADSTGPRVLEAGPSGDVTKPVDRVTLTFSEQIDPASFAIEDVALTGPAGAITPTAVNKLSITEYEIVFPEQSALGTYSLTVGPEIADIAGNAMDQDEDGTKGEATEDQFTTGFNLVEATFSGAKLDFGMPDSPVASGYTPVTAWTSYDPATGYGWQSGTVLHGDRGPTGDDLTRDFNVTQAGTFVLDLPNGTYDVTLVLGDVLAFPRDLMAVSLEGQLVETVTAPPAQIVTRTYRTAVSDGQLTLELEDQGGSTIYVMIDALEVQAAPAGSTGPRVLEADPEGSFAGPADRTTSGAANDAAIADLLTSEMWNVSSAAAAYRQAVAFDGHSTASARRAEEIVFEQDLWSAWGEDVEDAPSKSANGPLIALRSKLIAPPGASA